MEGGAGSFLDREGEESFQEEGAASRAHQEAHPYQEAHPFLGEACPSLQKVISSAASGLGIVRNEKPESEFGGLPIHFCR